MTQALLASRSGRPARGADALKAAAALWFVVAMIGQWIFLAFILASYGASTLSGDFQAWSRNTFLIKGYVAGDTVGNLAFGAHALLAAAIAFGGALQLVPQIRARAPAAHRWIGRVFLLAATAASLIGLYMTWVRGASLSLVSSLANSLDAVLIVGFAALAWRSARARDFAAHRRWGLRLYLAANGVWFLRVGVFGWVLLNGGHAVGMTHRLDGPLNIVLNFGCYLIPLAVLELYFRAQSSARPAGRWAVAGGLGLLTAFMSVGIVGVSLFFAKAVF